MKTINSKILRKIKTEVVNATINKNLESFDLINILNKYFPNLNSVVAEEFYILKNKKNKNTNFFFIQEFHKTDLFDKIEEIHYLYKPKEIQLFIEKIKTILSHYEKVGIVFLDLKSENILVSNNFEPIFIDFDDCYVSKSFQKLYTIQWTQKILFGTDAYMHPDYYNLIITNNIKELSKPINFITAKKYMNWALGLLQYEILTQERAWEYPIRTDTNFNTFIVSNILPFDKKGTLEQMRYIHFNIKPKLLLK